MELALRTPAVMGLTDAVRRQDQVLVADKGRYEMSSRGRRVTQFPHRESNDSHWEVGLQKLPSHVARENELIYVKNICFSVNKIFKKISSCRSHVARENELIYVKNSCFTYIKYLKNLAAVVAGEE
jgi:hypothetical protein